MSIIDSGHDPRATRATIANVSTDRQTALGGALRFDNNKYSVNASAVGAPVEIHANADRILFRRQKGRVVAEHARAFGRGATIFGPWHYVPVLARKPGALQNGAPFNDWVK